MKKLSVLVLIIVSGISSTNTSFAKPPLMIDDVTPTTTQGSPTHLDDTTVTPTSISTVSGTLTLTPAPSTSISVNITPIEIEEGDSIFVGTVPSTQTPTPAPQVKGDSTQVANTTLLWTIMYFSLIGSITGGVFAYKRVFNR